MNEMEVKFKRIDTGKFWSAGKLKEGKFGPQIGMKKSPELQAYLDSVPEGGWINFNLYVPRMPVDEVGAGYKKIASDLEADLGDGVPF